MTERIRGAVKFFSPRKGYGFLIPDAGGEDVFVHKSDLSNALLGALKEGRTVTFEIMQTQKANGRKAVNVEAA